MTTGTSIGECRERLKELLSTCIQTGAITLSSGKTTDFYFDGRQVTLDPEGSVLVAELMLGEILARGIGAVGGLTSGADPITSAVGVLAWQRDVPLRLFFVRKERKEHGTRKSVEGPPLLGDGERAGPGSPRVALVDDVLTTGGSLLRARDGLVSDTGLTPELAMVIVDRDEGGRERVEAEGLELVSLFHRGDFR